MNNPAISVVVEGYNDSLDLGSAAETLETLAHQDYPTRNVQVILVGSDGQARAWRDRFENDPRFHSIRFIGASGVHYYQQKNMGASLATGDILAFIDSDALPEKGWLQSIERGINAGADAVAGISLFRMEQSRSNTEEGRFHSALLLVAASISWGFVTGDPPRGFLSHNLAFRRSTFLEIRYREDLGRTCAGSFLYAEFTSRRLPMKFQKDQRVRHVFTLRWWLTRLHLRFGHEVYLLKRLNDSSPHRWVRHLSIFEPLATMAWHVFLDIPQWFHVSRLLGLGLPARLAHLPLLLSMSIAARGAEAAGMYASLFSPERMRRFALSN